MFKNNSGFTFVEALVAFKIILIVIFTVAPVVNIIHFEREILYERRMISSKLQEDLQEYIYQPENLPYVQSQRINNQLVNIQINMKLNYIKACAFWLNLKQREEKVCLYGLPIYE